MGSSLVLGTHREFLNEFKEITKSFASVSQKTASYKQQVVNLQKDFIQGFSKQVDDFGRNAEQQLGADSVISNSFKQVQESCQTIIAQFQKNLDYLENQEKVKSRVGDDSLVVFVAGKVKAGKSSLGNYMFFGKTEPQPDYIASLPEDEKPKRASIANANVAIGDQANALEKSADRGFGVNETEATSSIQAFTLGSFTWVDSPGLHSTQVQNGQLTIDYLKSADLVLYTTNSEAPGRESDLVELRKIIVDKKPLVLLITGSDTTDIDVDDNGEICTVRIMKPLDDRNKQCAVMRQALENALVGVKEISDPKAVVAQIPIFSVSTKYAEEHATDKEEMWDSGMPLLFNVINRIADGEQVKVLKMGTPLRNYLAMLQGTERYLEECRHSVEALAKTANQAWGDTVGSLDLAKKEAVDELRNCISQDFEKLANYRDNAADLNNKLKTMQPQWIDKLQELCGGAVNEAIEQFAQQMSQQASKVSTSVSLHLSNFKIDEREEDVAVGRRVSTRGSRSRLGILIGGIGGFLLGGPVGAAAGAAAGGLIGNRIGSDGSIIYETIREKVGDNFMALKRESQEQCARALESSIDDAFNAIEQGIQPIFDQLQALGNSCVTLEKELQGFDHKISDEIGQLKSSVAAKGSLADFVEEINRKR